VKKPSAGTGSVIGNVLWVVLCGWWLALGHLLTGVLLFLTIIGIPLALANFKLIPVAFWPFGREIVASDVAHQHGEPVVSMPGASGVAQRPAGKETSL
jgi:uncharacterized membrane protein YccF (DUF307 family)